MPKCLPSDEARVGIYCLQAGPSMHKENDMTVTPSEKSKKTGCLPGLFAAIGSAAALLGKVLYQLGVLLVRFVKWGALKYAGLWRKSKVWGKIGLVVAPMVLIGMLASLGGGSGDPAPITVPTAQVAQAPETIVMAPTATPTEPEPTATQGPTTTLVPTSTPKPTRTPLPTKTTTPTPEPTATLTEAQSYFSAVLPYWDLISQASTNIGILFQEPRLGDEKWTIAVAAQMASIHVSHDSVAEMTPPDEVAHIHVAILDVTAPMAEAMVVLADGMDTLDATKIERATELMSESEKAIPAFSALMDEYQAQLSLTDTPAKPPMPATDPSSSGSIGLDRTTWEQEHVMTGMVDTWPEYDDGEYLVIFMDEKIWHIERSFGDDQPDLANARRLAKNLFPPDAQLLETYSPEGLPELTVDLYMSDSLAQRFEASLFSSGEPGNFIAIYGVFDGKVPRVVIGIGNNS